MNIRDTGAGVPWKFGTNGEAGIKGMHTARDGEATANSSIMPRTSIPC